MSMVSFEDVWEMYHIKYVIKGKPQVENFWALRGVTFSLEKGDVLGIIGENGSGKSTLLKIIVGIMKPSRGKVITSGRATGLLDLGAGFQSEFTGQDNIYFNANLFGLTQKQIDHVYNDIEAFASLGKFIYAPVQCYSQGMFVRLSFSIAIHMNPDILVIDDTLSVGDEYFQKKCLKKIFELKEMGKTIIFATHDMSLLKKLSQRAILLKDGRVVSDGLINKVLPLYTQMVGAKQGVAVLEKNGLELVFNNGRMFLNLQGHLITPQPGIYVNFLIDGKWCNSSEAEWQVEKNENKLIARGSFYHFELMQIWQIELTADGQIALDMHFEGKDSIDIQERCVGIMLSHEYQRWLTLIGEGAFPPIDEKQTTWSDVIGDDSPPNCVGLEGEKETPSLVPSLIVKQVDASSSRIRLLNTDYFTNARVLEYREKRTQNNASGQDYSSLGFSGEIIVGCENAKSYFQSIKSDYSLARDKFKLIFDKGKCSVFFDNKKLTKARDFATVFYMNNMWHSSERACWKCGKENENKLIARGVWPGLGVAQVWTIELMKGNAFSWLVEMEVDKEVEIPEQHLQLMFSEGYNSYQSHCGQGPFPEKFLENEVDLLQRSIPEGKVCLMDSNQTSPVFSLEISKKEGTFLKIFNTDLSYRARELRAGRVEPENESKFFPGKYFCFKMIGEIGGAAKLLTVRPEKILKKGNMGFSFHKGSGRMFWGSKELTKKMGVYTSLNFQGRWHNSPSDAVWTAGEDKNGMLFIGEWLQLPLVQTWQFEFKKPDSINWKIELDVRESIELEQLQVNIMLSELYGKWMSGDAEGDMPPFEDDMDDEWQAVWRGGEVSNKNINFVKLFSAQKDAGFPGIRFSLLDNENPKHFLNIVNSDICHRGRILQCKIEADRGIFMPGKYSICNSTVTLEKP